MILEELIWPALRGIGMLLFYLFVEFIPEISIWTWQRLRRSKEPPMDFSTIHNERKTKRLERRAERLEKRQERIGSRGAPIE